MTTVNERLRALYAEGDVPWDAPLPPPELMALAETLPVGRALDLGCGYGRAAIYLAQQGWRVDAVDLINLALIEAVRRSQVAGIRPVSYSCASVTRLPFPSAAYDFAVDVGCAHNLNRNALFAYCSELKRLLRPGARFLLFGRISQPQQVAQAPVVQSTDGEDEVMPDALSETCLRDFLADAFILERYEPGITTMGDGTSWASAWFWWRRRC